MSLFPNIYLSGKVVGEPLNVPRKIEKRDGVTCAMGIFSFPHTQEKPERACPSCIPTTKYDN